MDIIFQVLTIVSNLLINIPKEARVCKKKKKSQLAFETQSGIWFRYLIVEVDWVSLRCTLVSRGFRWRYGGKNAGLDGKDFANSSLSSYLRNLRKVMGGSLTLNIFICK